MAYKNEKMLITMKSKTALKYHFPALSDWQETVCRQRGEIEAFQHRWWQPGESEFRAGNRNGYKHFKWKDFLQITGL